MIFHIVSYLLFDDCQKDSIAVKACILFCRLDFSIEIQSEKYEHNLRMKSYSTINPIDFFCV